MTDGKSLDLDLALFTLDDTEIAALLAPYLPDLCERVAGVRARGVNTARIAVELLGPKFPSYTEFTVHARTNEEAWVGGELSDGRGYAFCVTRGTLVDLLGIVSGDAAPAIIARMGEFAPDDVPVCMMLDARVLVVPVAFPAADAGKPS